MNNQMKIMKPKSALTKRSSKQLNRRKFISSCAACGVCMAISPVAAFGPASSFIGKNMRIKVIYSLHSLVQDRPDWPNIGYNFEPFIDHVNRVLKKQFPSFEFISVLASVEEDAEAILEKDENEKIDGYIVYQMNCWNRIVQTIVKSGKPVLYVDFKYGGSGGFLVYTADFLSKDQPNLGFVSSSRMGDVVAAVKCFEIVGKGGSVEEFVAATRNARLERTPSSGNLSFRSDHLETLPADETLRRMKKSKILAVRSQDSGPADPVMGIPMEYVAFAEVNEAWKNADKAEANGIAKKWQENSFGVVDVSFEELENSAAMYLGMKSVLKKHNANAITINCLGGFYGNHIHAYPCLGFHQLNNEGFIGACECDIRSTATMVAFTTMTQGRPGYISDPVIDTSKRQIIYAHCVAPNKMFGPDGPTNPYVVMNHSEDRQGAAVRSILPAGYLTTSLEIDDAKKEILFHQAKAVENDPDDRACRTKLCAEPVGDMEKLFTKWHTWSWHRVTFYGDLKEPVYDLANAMGWKVIEEA
jgi:ferredoxin